MRRVAAAPVLTAWNPTAFSAAFNRIGPQDQGEFETPSRGNPTRRHYIGGIVFIVISLLVFLYWAGVPLLNTQFFHGYSRLGSPTVEFRSARYGWDWWTIWLLTLNGLAPLLLARALTENKIQEYSRAHGFIVALLLLVNLWCFAVLSIRWCAFCNRSGTPGSTACNDYRYGCVYFGASTENTHWCPNGIGCTPAVTSGDLYRNAEYFQHWLFSIIFFLMAFLHLGVKDSLAKFGLFSNVDEE